MQKQLIEIIEKMRIVDQDTRNLAVRQKDAKTNDLLATVDRKHNSRIHELIEEFGYPDTEMVGEEGLKDFWLLVQHQDGDLGLQKDCFEKCDFAPKEKALLVDRIKVNSGEEQEYGTQLQMGEDKKLTPKPIHKPEDVDSRRKEVGLGPLSEYVDRLNKKYGG